MIYNYVNLPGITQMEVHTLAVVRKIGKEEIEQLKESLHKMYEAAKREIELRKKEQKEESRNGKDI